MPAGDRHPFAYPTSAHKRRHRPPQFSRYQQYKPWLRDEFVFTCVYCLSRETWSRNSNFYGVEHFKAKSSFKAGIVDYDNLLYACNECNRIKGAKTLPADLHPEMAGWGNDLQIQDDGSIVGLNKRGVAIIKWFELDSAELTLWRFKHLDLYKEAMKRARTQHVAQTRLKHYFGFPQDMPHFSANSGAMRPYSARAELPEWY
jgi:hypothetical protein